MLNYFLMSYQFDLFLNVKLNYFRYLICFSPVSMPRFRPLCPLFLSQHNSMLKTNGTDPCAQGALGQDPLGDIPRVILLFSGDILLGWVTTPTLPPENRHSAHHFHFLCGEVNCRHFLNLDIQLPVNLAGLEKISFKRF